MKIILTTVEWVSPLQLRLRLWLQARFSRNPSRRAQAKLVLRVHQALCAEVQQRGAGDLSR